MSIPEVDDDKIDITLSSRYKGSRSTKPKIDIQAKSLTAGPIASDPFPYSIDESTHANLRDTMCAIPRLLVVVLLPTDYQDWLKQDHHDLAMRHCGYWYSLKGEADIFPKKSKTIHVPKTNIFGPLELQAIMKLVADGLDVTSPLTLGAMIE